MKNLFKRIKENWHEYWKESKVTVIYFDAQENTWKTTDYSGSYLVTSASLELSIKLAFKEGADEVHFVNPR